MKRALLVIDVQSYFLQDAPADLPNRIAEQIEGGSYDLILFTVFKGEAGSNYERSLHWPGCRKESDQVIPLVLEPFIKQDNKFVKTTYSAFHGTGVQSCLQSAGITNLEICGIDLEACVLATAFAAFDLGYDTKVLFDLCHRRFAPKQPVEEIINRNIQSKHAAR